MERPIDFGGGAATEVQFAGEGLRLAARGGGFAARGEYLSGIHESEFPLDNAVLSWNADAPAGTTLRFELRTRTGSGWTAWYAMGEWGNDGGRSVPGQADGHGRVNVDTLELSAPATALQYRVRLDSSSAVSSPLVRLISVAYADTRAGPMGPAMPSPRPSPTGRGGSAESPTGRGGSDEWRELEVPRESQLEQDPAVAQRICSPTSLAMVLQYWGIKKTVPEVIAGVRDRTTGIYGNWPLNTAFAGAAGLESRVARLYAVEQLEQEIAAGRPVVISLTYGTGELSGSATAAAPNGHLIVVRGFTAQGDIITNDPVAASSASVRRVYKREQLGRIWLRSGGITYLVSPRNP